MSLHMCCCRKWDHELLDVLLPQCDCVCVVAAATSLRVCCCRKWDHELLDFLLPQLLPQLHGKTVQSENVKWKLAAVQGFLLRFHLQVYQQLRQTLVCGLLFGFSLSLSVTAAVNGHLYIKTLQTLYYEYLNLIIDDNTTTLI